MTTKVPDELNADSVRILLERGKNQAEIARIYDKSRQYISKLATTHCEAANENTLRKQIEKAYPWDLSRYMNIWNLDKPFHRAYLNKLLRDHLAFLLAEGADMSLSSRKRLRAFYHKLKTENLVIEFHPTIEPTEYNNVGGFAYRPHDERLDGNLMIRQNELTEIDAKGAVIWKLPPTWPDIDE